MTGHSPADAIVGRSDGRERRGWSKPGAAAPLGAQRPDRVDHDRRLLDGVDGAAGLPVGLVHLGMARPSGHADHEVFGAAARDPRVEPGRLGDDPGVGLDAALDDRRPAGARRLLVGVRRDEQIAGELHAECGRAARSRTPSRRSRPSCRTPRGRRACRREPRRETAGSSTARPGSAETTSMCPFRSSDLPAPAPRTRATSCGRPAKSRPGGTRGLPRSARRPAPTGRSRPPRARSRAARYSCRARLLPRRVADVPRGRVERDQVGGQLHELVPAPLDLGADELLALAQHRGLPVGAQQDRERCEHERAELGRDQRAAAGRCRGRRSRPPSPRSQAGTRPRSTLWRRRGSMPGHGGNRPHGRHGRGSSGRLGVDVALQPRVQQLGRLEAGPPGPRDRPAATRAARAAGAATR